MGGQLLKSDGRGSRVSTDDLHARLARTRRFAPWYQAEIGKLQADSQTRASIDDPAVICR